MKKQHAMKMLCDQVFALNPAAQSLPEAKSDYIIIRFSETPDHVITELCIVDPVIPDVGSYSDWLRLEQYQQLNVGFSKKAAELLKEMGGQLVEFNAKKRPWESREEFAQRVEIEQEVPGHDSHKVH